MKKRSEKQEDLDKLKVALAKVSSVIGPLLGGFFVDFSSQKHTGSKYVDLTILSADGRVRR